MFGELIIGHPGAYQEIREATIELKFNMGSDVHTGSLLKTLARSKASARVLELGTGTGLATSWILDGLDETSTLITIDDNPELVQTAKAYIDDRRIQFLVKDANRWIAEYRGEPFDLIFADAIPGKYELLNETLGILKKGGFYVIDDMLPQPNWPMGHDKKVEELIRSLNERTDLVVIQLNWSTGIIIAVKI